MTTAMACELANAHAPYMQVRRRSHMHDHVKHFLLTCTLCCRLRWQATQAPLSFHEQEC